MLQACELQQKERNKFLWTVVATHNVLLTYHRVFTLDHNELAICFRWNSRCLI
uniref:Uncharacterized protein n=1 Tax=Physcomitrium patens TaxID=3218 RepID=A0A2K1JR55_PHYPA|nr:hypothetical protein PHYPA_016395 [Physcomitrium patens]